MNYSHGLLKKIIPKETIKRISIKCESYLKKVGKIENYYGNIAEDIPEIIEIINNEIYQFIKKSIECEKPFLCNTELHIQVAQCNPIPPHQDNFYHCIDGEKGLKILVPLSDLDSRSGGLIFLDTPIDFPVIDHKPSKIKNFSSQISQADFREIKSSQTSYDYYIGDASYHYLNSIHFSKGNKSNKDKLFIVFRYQDPDAKEDLSALKRYNNCVEKHKQLIY